MTKIVQIGADVLRNTAEEVPIDEITGEKIQSIIKCMLERLNDTKDGVALAAPQIGVPLRIFVVSGERSAQEQKTIEKVPDMVFINPSIIKKSRKKDLLTEGCLSVKGVYGHIYRADKATIRAYNEHGEKITRGGSGLMAQIFQHEMDHLDGILFTDKTEDIIEQGIQPKIVFFGSMDFSVYVLESSGILPDLIVTIAPKPQGRRHELIPNAVEQWALGHDVPVVHKLPGYVDADSVFIIAGYGTILKNRVLDVPKYGVLNVHPSLLPRHRGPSPIQQAILDKDDETGVSIILADKGVDHGDVISNAKFQNTKDYTFKALENKLGLLGGKLLAETLPRWVAGKIKPKEQAHDKATFTNMIKKADGLVDLEKDSGEFIDRKLRAYSEWPGVYFITKKKGKPFRVQITKGRVEHGGFVIERVKPEGKNEMSYKDFMRGARNISY